MLCFLQIFFKHGSTAFELKHVERRGVICFLWSEGIKMSESYRRMLMQYGEQERWTFAVQGGSFTPR
jgi:hypothetical protein